MNIPKICEIAVTNALKARVNAAQNPGVFMAADELFYNGFLAAQESERRFPQIQILIGPEVPQGHQSNMFKLGFELVVVTYIVDDELRVSTGAIYEQVRIMITEANADEDAWTAAYLTDGVQLGAITVEDGDSDFDNNYGAITVTGTMEVCVC